MSVRNLSKGLILHKSCLLSLSLSHLIDQSKLLFWKKMYASNNVILYSMSRHIRGRFMAVASCYGVFCPLQSVGVINLLSGHHAETLNC